MSNEIITKDRLAESLQSFNEKGVLPVAQGLDSLKKKVGDVKLSIGDDGAIYATYENNQ